MNTAIRILLLAFLVCFTACDQAPPARNNSSSATKDTSTAETARRNAAVKDSLPLDDPQDFEDCRRGLIASDPDLRVTGPEGTLIWDQPAYAFIKGKAPATVNPSLWRQAKLNSIHGLFKVTEGIYQLRGFCLSNMTIIEGETGWIIVDPLTTLETAAHAFAFARKHLTPKPIRAVIFTHSHIDHFGGIQGILSEEEVKKGDIRIIAPKGFMEEATSENILAGVAMGRRAGYMYGRDLPPSPTGHVDNGLGKRTPFGTFGLLAPTELVSRTPQEEIIDGVRFIFQYAPDSEAPAELTFYLPDKKTYCGAEVVSRHMHNLYTLRGAKIRDALNWSNTIDTALTLFGSADIYFGCHHWPIWGNARVVDFLKKQRDTYKYIHDQSLRLANSGLTPLEIAEELRLPEPLRTSFSSRGYYGTLRHNARAVYQAYFGWYDANPAHLNPLPPRESAMRYVTLMGGAAKVIGAAQEAYDKGEYRWVAELLNHLVFAEPENDPARALLADAYEQLGYQAESGPWRNVYLTGARELRHGKTKGGGIDLARVFEMLKRTPVHRFFDSMAVRLNGPDAEGKKMVVNVRFTDIGESHVLTLENAVLNHREREPDPQADVTISVTHELFLRMLTGMAGIKETVFSEDLSVTGSKIDLVRFLMLFDRPSGDFNIVTP